MNRLHLWLCDALAVASALLLIVAYFGCAFWQVVVTGEEKGDDL